MTPLSNEEVISHEMFLTNIGYDSPSIGYDSLNYARSIVDKLKKPRKEFKTKDGHRPNLNTIPVQKKGEKGNGWSKVYYSNHCLNQLRLPSRDHLPFPYLSKTRSKLHPYNLKRDWWKLSGIEGIGAHPSNWVENEFGVVEPINFYDRLDWEFDFFDLKKMSVEKYSTINDKSDGELNKVRFVGKLNKSFYAMVVEINYNRVSLLSDYGFIAKDNYFIQALTMFPQTQLEFNKVAGS